MLKIAANHYLIIICFEECVGQKKRKKTERESQEKKKKSLGFKNSMIRAKIYLRKEVEVIVKKHILM